MNAQSTSAATPVPLRFDRIGRRRPAPGPAGAAERSATRRGVAGRPAREVAALVALLVATTAVYLWNLTASGYANSFYAAAVEAGTRSWKAFFFGSIDSGNFITVDKPPASLWVMELSGRLFGFGSASMLVPQVLEGVLTVAVLYAVVRRWHGHRAGLIAGVVMATTPVAALMFRFNNPDALLTLLITTAAYGVTRALEGGRTRWLVVAGTALGFAFLAKMGQALLVVPGFAAAYLVAAPGPARRRVAQLVAGGVALVASAGWWVLAVTLWPASSRPLIDGSPTNSIWNLIVAYNGLDRVVSSTSGGPAGSNFSGATGFLRLFNDVMGAQASWLLPVAGAVLVTGLVVTARRPRTDRTRAALILWGGWLAVTAAVFSFGQGVIHTYYTVALAPAIAALVAIGCAGLASRWENARVRAAGAAGVAATAAWAYVLLGRTPSWSPWLRPALLVAAAAAVAGLLAAPSLAGRARRLVFGTALAATCFAVLAGPTAYALETVATAHTGSVPSAGPGGGGFAGGPATARGGLAGGPSGSSSGLAAGLPSGGFAGAGGPGGRGLPGGFGPGSGSGGTAGTPPTAAGPSGGGQAGAAESPSSALVKALEEGSSRFRWVAAIQGSQSAATLELAADGDPVMAIGGFNNQAPRLTLAQFEKYVAAGQIHYYIAGRGPGGPGAGSSGSTITSWVESHFKAATIGDTTVYDLTARVG
jgi:4-amino-4-deoxy-L-arabinose transferase-like glycosyltransferase